MKKTTYKKNAAGNVTKKTNKTIHNNVDYLSKNTQKKPTILSGLLIVGIGIVGFIFILSGMKLLFEEPKYEDFCKNLYTYPEKSIKVCNNTPDYPQYCNGVPIPEFNASGCVTSYTCSNCNILYDNARNSYNRNVFMISIFLGIIMIVASAFITIPTVQNGLFITSIITIIFGSINYWSALGKYLQFSLIGIALASLIIISYKLYTASNENKN